MMQSTVTAPVLSPLSGKAVPLNFDGAQMSSDAVLTYLPKVERRSDLADELTKCLADPREPGTVRHSLLEIIRFRMMIAVGYEDGKTQTPCRMILY